MQTQRWSHQSDEAFAGRQLRQLARDLAGPDSDDLAGRVAGNPDLAREWIADLRRRREELADDIQMFDAAVSRVLAAQARRNRSAA